ncbi:trypsin-1-like [Penaeus monodon]|uniref:trypsin-1-like n=1 Tax=Penaeus monodon TaxID=6687 RepID=UPI0018A74B24|nr:trypsin-1-like [Penaeus monodon]
MIRITFLAAAFALAAGVPHVPRLDGALPRLPKIVGGVEASPGEFPHQISMQRNSIFGRSHSCGGSIFNENYIVTAGHCVHGQSASKIFIVAGEYDLSTASGDEQESAADALIEHEHYDGNTITNDIALIRLATPFVMNSLVQPIELPAQGEYAAAGESCTTTGWGTTVEGGFIPDILRKVDVPIVDDDTCRQSYGVTEIADSMLCAGLPEGGKDACQGDSGGPFVCGGKLHGITSWGYGCARPNYPGVYTEVAYYRDWVDAHAV